MSTAETIDEAPEVPAVIGQPCEGCGTATLFADLAHAVGLPGARHLLCPKCREAARELGSDRAFERAAKRRSAIAVTRVQRIIELAVNADEEAAPTVHSLLNAMTDAVGGVERAGAIWAELINEMHVDGNKRMLLDALDKYARLLLAATPKIEEAIKYREMSDQELAEQQRIAAERAFALELVQEHPEWGAALEQKLAARQAAKTDDSDDRERTDANC